MNGMRRKQGRTYASTAFHSMKQQAYFSIRWLSPFPIPITLPMSFERSQLAILPGEE